MNEDNNERPQVFFDLKESEPVTESDMQMQPQPPEKPKKKKAKFATGLVVGIIIGIAASLAATVIYNVITISKLRSYSTGSSTTQFATYEDKINSILAYLDAYYIGEIDEDMVADGLSKGLLSGINDKYAQYYTQEEFQDLIESSSGQYGGIGVSVVMNDDDKIEVYKVFDNSPAKDAGIQARDLIIEADGVRNFEDLDSLVSIVRGEPGTTVDLVIYRNGEEIPMTVERRQVSNPTVEYKMRDDGIGYIYISEFDTVSVDQFSAAVDALEAEGMRALIIDVRDNPGGDYDAVVAMSDRVLPKGVIISTQDKNGTEKVEYSDDEHQITVPMVILVNENTASAAELFSGAIQDYGIGQLVGVQTYGKGVVQSIFQLKDGSGMKFTTEKYYIPSGVCIDGVGLTPDYVVEIPDEAYVDGVITEEEDTQLKKAIEILK